MTNVSFGHLAGLIGSGVLAAAAWGEVTLVSDQRGVTVEAAGQLQFAFPSPAFSEFSRDLTRNAPSGGGFGFARAQQNSTISTGVMTATGRVRAESSAGPNSCILSQSTSDFRVLFTVSGPVQCDASGSVAGAQFRLGNNLEGTVALVESTGATLPIATQSILRPGRQYTVLAQASRFVNQCNGGTLALDGEYTLSVTLTALAPCPGDLNYDRVVDDMDFTIFASAYNELLCAAPPVFCDADLNGDSVVDDVDFVIFAESYNELICP